jgi:DNA-binding NtrC family response regulator
MKNKAKIILLDLDGELSAALRTFFENQGHEMVLGLHSNGSNFEEAIILARLSSHETAAQLMRSIREKAPHAPVILLISNPSFENPTHAMVAGADFACDEIVRLEDLKILVDRALAQARQRHEMISLRDQLEKSSASSFGALLSDFPTLEEVEKRYLKIVLEKTRGRKEKASRILGINRRTLYRKEREYGWVSDDESEISLEPKEVTAPRFS